LTTPFIDTSGPGYYYEIPPWATRIVKADPDDGGRLCIDSTVEGKLMLRPLEDHISVNWHGAGDNEETLIGIYRAGIKLSMEEQFQRDGGSELLERLAEIADRIDPKAKLRLDSRYNIKIHFSDGSRYE
jgi:hypothetical protein